jgi:hypothetical protein
MNLGLDGSLARAALSASTDRVQFTPFGVAVS